MEERRSRQRQLGSHDGSHRPIVPVIVGPTASGKTWLSIEIARRVPGIEIVSADSRQVYVGMDIGTAKPPIHEQRETPHHLIDIVDPRVNYTAGDYATDGRSAISGILDRGHRPVVVGGSGFYIRALFNGLGAPTVDQDIYEQVVRRAELEGYDVIVQELQRVDPVAAAAQSSHNRVKIFRALACYVQTGRPFSSFVEGDAIVAAPFVPIYLGLSPPRTDLYVRINDRVVEMVNGGLIEETVGLLRAGIPLDAPGFRTVGYAEALRHLAGEMSVDLMIAAIQQSTRRYAKRQLTWFRKVQDVEWYDRPDVDAAIAWLHRIG